jgi:sarcosine oxidase
VHGVPGFKFGKYHHLEEVVDPETLDRETHDYDEQLLRDFAERYFPDGCGPTMDLQTCMFTNTPDNHFVIDVHPDYEQVSFASPCSGHGYKFASVIGEIMADLADTGITRHDIGLFRLDRLTQTARRQPASPVSPAGSTDGQTHERNGHSRSFPRVPDVRPFW